MTEFSTGKNDDIDSKIADFMADIDEIVLGKKCNSHSDEETSEWTQCFDETSQSVYYWNRKTNECSWEPPSINQQKITESNHSQNKKRAQQRINRQSPKKQKKPSLIAEYESSESEDEEETVDDIDELLEEVLEKEEKLPPIDPHSLFESDCRAAIDRLVKINDQTIDIITLRIQLETRLEDYLTGHLSKSYAMKKLEEALVKIDQHEKSQPIIPEPVKPTLTSSEMALLLSLPPPPPPSSPPPPPDNDPTLELFYAQLNSESSTSASSEIPPVTKFEHHHHHHHKDKKSKPSKNLPTDLIEKWAHARQELRGIGEMNES